MKPKEPQRAGVIDIGTNSIKLLVAEESEAKIKVLESLKNVVQLGKDTFFKDRISQESINRTVSILEKYVAILKEYEVTNVRVIATTAVREAQNKDVFVDTVFRRTGFNIEILTPGDVVYFIDAYLYHTLKDKYPLHDKNLLITELGGGSLDISLMAHGFTLMNVGLPLGTLRLMQFISRLDGTTFENYEAATESIESEFAYLKRSLPAISIDDILLIDESHSSYLSAVLPKRTLQGEFFQITQADTQELTEKVLNRSPEDISAEYKIPIETANTFAGFVIILNTLITFIESKTIYILEASLAEAIVTNEAMDYEISQKYNKANQLISIAISAGRKYGVDLEHARQVAQLSDTLFDLFKEILGLKKTDSLYLTLAAYLHDIGMFIYNRAHHKHSEYIISSIDWFRLSSEEVKIIACIARYHRKGAPAYTHPLYWSLPPAKQILVQKLSSILKIANALDRSHRQKVKKIEIKINRSNEITLLVTVQGNFILEKIDFTEKKGMFEELSGNKLTLKIQSAL